MGNTSDGKSISMKNKHTNPNMKEPDFFLLPLHVRLEVTKESFHLPIEKNRDLSGETK